MSKYYLILLSPLILFFSFKISKLFNVYDYPDNKRKIHDKPTLIVGGVFFKSIILFFFILFIFFEKNNFSQMMEFNKDDHLLLLTTITILFLIGFYDDKKNLRPILKLFFVFLIFLISLIYFSDNYKLKKLI